MPTLGEQAVVMGKRERKRLSDNLMALTNRGVVRCVFALKAREWHEDLIAARLGQIMSSVGNTIANSELVAGEGGELSPRNWTHAGIIGMRVALEMDVAMQGEDN